MNRYLLAAVAFVVCFGTGAVLQTWLGVGEGVPVFAGIATAATVSAVVVLGGRATKTN
jgi:hypothetical protein